MWSDGLVRLEPFTCGWSQVKHFRGMSGNLRCFTCAGVGSAQHKLHSLARLCIPKVHHLYGPQPPLVFQKEIYTALFCAHRSTARRNSHRRKQQPPRPRNSVWRSAPIIRKLCHVRAASFAPTSTPGASSSAPVPAAAPAPAIAGGPPFFSAAATPAIATACPFSSGLAAAAAGDDDDGGGGGGVATCPSAAVTPCTSLAWCCTPSLPPDAGTSWSWGIVMEPPSPESSSVGSRALVSAEVAVSLLAGVALSAPAPLLAILSPGATYERCWNGRVADICSQSETFARGSARCIEHIIEYTTLRWKHRLSTIQRSRATWEEFCSQLQADTK